MANGGGSVPALPSYEGVTLPSYEGPVLLSYEDLKRLGINYSREGLWRLEAANKFPRRIYLSSQRVAWFASEVYQWLADRAAERTNRIYKNHD